MFRRPASFALWVLGLLLLQWTLGVPPGGPAPGLHLANGVGAMGQVCSVGGTTPDTAPGLPDPESAIAEACCWACSGPSLAMVPRVTSVSVPVAYATSPAIVARVGLTVPRPTGFKPQSRAPPVVV